MIYKYMPVLVLAAGIIACLYALPAFPGAVGWGGEVTGGRGGQVIHVTSTSSYGAGTLDAACAVSGAKIIVFDVSGVIDRASQPLYLNSNTTIAGQTSPNGITIINGGLYSDNNANIIVRHMRVRRSPDAADGDCYRFSHCHDIMVDHCSSMWCSDEILDCSYSTYNMTFQNMVVASPGQCHAVYGCDVGCGNNRTGILIVGTDGRFTFYRCLFAHQMKRTPYLTNDKSGPFTGKTFELINNVFYNNMQNGDESFNNNTIPLNLMGNYYMPGPNAAYPANPYAHTGSIPASMVVHSSGNFNTQYPNITNQAAFFNYQSVWGGMNGFIDTMIVPRKTTTILTARDAYTRVCTQVGPFPRDSADSRVVREVQTGTGQWQQGCDPAPDPYLPGGGTPPTDTDRDGMPDSWETAHGLNPGNAADRTTDLGGADAGYNAVEVYINELADQKTPPVEREAGPRHGIANSLDNMIHVTPNPFTASALIRLNEGEIQVRAKIRIFDLSGRLVSTLEAAREGVSWNSADSPAGVYVAQCLVKGRTYSQRMLLIK